MIIWQVNGSRKLTIFDQSVENINGIWKYRAMPGAALCSFEVHNVPKTDSLRADARIFFGKLPGQIAYIGLTPRMALRLFIDGFLTANGFLRYDKQKIVVSLCLSRPNGLELIAHIRTNYGEPYIFFADTVRIPQ